MPENFRDVDGAELHRNVEGEAKPPRRVGVTSISETIEELGKKRFSIPATTFPNFLPLCAAAAAAAIAASIRLISAHPLKVHSFKRVARTHLAIETHQFYFPFKKKKKTTSRIQQGGFQFVNMFHYQSKLAVLR